MTTLPLPFPDDDADESRRVGITEEQLAELFGIPFTDEQLDAITAPHGPAVVIAGAGSGKTSLMSARVLWLVANGVVSPDQVLGLTFTNKAATELSSRVRRALRRLELREGHTGLLDEGEPTISTYHAYAGSLLREYGVWGGYEPGAQLLTDAQRFLLAEAVVRGAPGPFPALGVKVKAVTERVVDLEAEINEHLVDIDELERCDRALIAELDELERVEGRLTADPSRARNVAKARLELVGLVREYRREKQRRERVDFGDQMASAARLAECVGEVSRGERDRFATVLLDEYQDTSMAQQRLLVALFGNAYPVMAVGDPFQSIYGWRGASIRNILSFQHDFEGADGTPVFALGQNNRSGGRILQAANRIAESLREAFPEVARLRPRAGLEDAGEVVVGMYRTASQEVEAVCDEVAAEIAGGREPSEIAVLCRETKVFPDVIAGLTQRKVPVDVVGLSGLLEVPEVVDVVSVLEVLHDPTANPHMVRILAGPRWRIGPVDLALLGSRARSLSSPRRDSTTESTTDSTESTRSLADELQAAVEGTDPSEAVSLLEALNDPGPLDYSAEARERFAELSAELDAMRGVLDLPPDAAVMQVIDRIGLDVELAVEGRPRDHLDALIEQARLFTASGGGTTLGPFLSYLHLAERYGDTLGLASPTGGGGVALLTVHRAKGLEWHSVYVPSVVAGSFPSTRSRSTPYTGAAVLPYELRGDASDFPTVATWSGNQGVQAFKAAVAERELAEDRRLAYVAVTRAARRLVVTGHRWGPTQQAPRDVSPYLQTLREACEAGIGSVLHWEPESAEGETNPALERTDEYQWPVSSGSDARQARQDAAALVQRYLADTRQDVDDAQLDRSEREVVAAWDRDIAALLAEASRSAGPSDVVPELVSATSAVAVLRNPAEARRRMRRPLPRPPADAAQRGTRFHEWVEARFGQVPLLDIDVFVDDAEDLQNADLAELQRAFLAGPYADRRPLAVEAPFQLVLGRATVAGRIDAVYRAEGVDGVEQHPGSTDHATPAVQFEVVDWKTGQHPADELQLALYRLAWAELNDVPLEAVSACFYYVATGEVVRPSELPDRAALTEWWNASTA